MSADPSPFQVEGVTFQLEDVAVQRRGRLQGVLTQAAQAPSGKKLFARLAGTGPVVILSTRASSTKIHVGADGKIEVNEDYLDTEERLLAAVFAHELEHVVQSRTYRRLPAPAGDVTPLSTIGEAAALSTEMQVAFELIDFTEEQRATSELRRLIAYFAYPSSTMQAWVASKYNWARAPMPPLAKWSPAASAYWKQIRETEQTWRDSSPSRLKPTRLSQEELFSNLADYFEELSAKGDNWSEEGRAGELRAQEVRLEFIREYEALGDLPAGAERVIGAGLTEAEQFLLQWSFLGSFDPATRKFKSSFPHWIR